MPGPPPGPPPWARAEPEAMTSAAAVERRNARTVERREAVIRDMEVSWSDSHEMRARQSNAAEEESCLARTNSELWAGRAGPQSGLKRDALPGRLRRDPSYQS